MSYQYLEMRLTHGYVGSWKHLDKHEPIALFKILRSFSYAPKDADYCEQRVTKHLVHVKNIESRPIRDIKRALYDEFTSWGCDHEYDCCGCRSYSCHDVRKCIDGNYLVIVHSSRNY